MAKSLGIFVTNPNQMRHVMGVTKAALAKGSKVKVFFTWWGTKLTATPEFAELCSLENVDASICADSYGKAGFDVNVVPKGLTKEKMGTQAQHGAIIEEYDCYLTL
ncbi:MAG: peroxiredoxin [Proteobacteria bacterium]|nr:peroxiredoxin [Desulfobulbaceae bacterium]MBU4151709.1 peroxiredoxin [Pseudomonadota bacterium]